MINCAILTISDTRSLRNDGSGDILEKLVSDFGCQLVTREVVTDDRADIRDALTRLSDSPEINLILTTGGTGLSPRDNTPEATRDVLEREAHGIAEAMRRETSGKTVMSILSRATAGTRANTLIINLPGSPKGVAECFEVIGPVLKHAVAQASGSSDHA